MTRRRRRLALTAAGGVAAATVVRARAKNRDLVNPCGPEGLALPDGERRTITTDDGAELAALIAGPVDGPVVVLPHCWMGAMSMWGAVARRLVASGHRVALYDQRGHGDSTLGSDPISVDRLGHDLHRVLEEFDLHDLVLGGHSMGGMTIQAFAATHPDAFRERVRGVVLVSTASHNGGYTRLMPKGLPEAIFGAKRDAQLAKQKPTRMRGVMGPDSHPENIAVFYDTMRRTQGVARAGFLTAMGAPMDYRSTLPTIKVPTKVLVGKRDYLTPKARARVLAKGIPDAELQILDRHGHFLNFEAPDAVADAIAGLAR
jgi:pimeloyl-ACP methyl ester carboxylesterase